MSILRNRLRKRVDFLEDRFNAIYGLPVGSGDENDTDFHKNFLISIHGYDYWVKDTFTREYECKVTKDDKVYFMKMQSTKAGLMETAKNYIDNIFSKGE